MKHNATRALVWLAFLMSVHQNATQKPIWSAPAYRVLVSYPGYFSHAEGKIATACSIFVPSATLVVLQSDCSLQWHLNCMPYVTLCGGVNIRGGYGNWVDQAIETVCRKLEQEKAVRSFVSSRDEFLSLPTRQWKVCMLCRITMDFSMSYSSKRKTVYRHCCISGSSHERSGKFDVSVPYLFIVERILIALHAWFV